MVSDRLIQGGIVFDYTIIAIPQQHQKVMLEHQKVMLEHWQAHLDGVRTKVKVYLPWANTVTAQLPSLL